MPTFLKGPFAFFLTSRNLRTGLLPYQQETYFYLWGPTTTNVAERKRNRKEEQMKKTNLTKDFLNSFFLYYF